MKARVFSSLCGFSSEKLAFSKASTSARHAPAKAMDSVLAKLSLTPKDIDPDQPLPLVLDFHGLMEGAEVHSKMTAMPEFGQANGFVVVNPHGTGNPIHWEIDPNAKTNPDIAYTSAMLDQLGGLKPQQENGWRRLPARREHQRAEIRVQGDQDTPCPARMGEHDRVGTTAQPLRNRHGVMSPLGECPCQAARHVLVEQESHRLRSRRRQAEPPLLPQKVRSVAQASPDIVRRERRILVENARVGPAIGHHPHHELDRDPRSPHHGFAAQPRWIDLDPVLPWSCLLYHVAIQSLPDKLSNGCCSTDYAILGDGARILSRRSGPS